MSCLLNPSLLAAGYTAEASALFARMTTAPTTTRKGQIDALIKALKAGATSGSNIWSKLVGLWLLAAADSQASVLNWKGSSGTPTISGQAPNFTADRGWASPSATTGLYLDTGWTDLTSQGLAATAWSMGFYQVDAAASTGYAVGNSTSTQFMQSGTSSGTAQARVTSFGGGGTMFGSATSGARHEMGSRTGSTATLYENGSSVSSVSASRAFATTDFMLCNAAASTQGSVSTIGACHVGTDLTAAEALDLYNALHDYLHAVGAV